MPGQKQKLNINQGDKLNITKNDIRATSSVESITKNDRLVITEPLISNVDMMHTYKGDKLNVTVFQGGGRLDFDIEVTNITRERGLTFLEVKLCSDVKRTQRREYVRIETLLDLHIVPFPDTEKTKELDDGTAFAVVKKRRLSGTVTPDDMVTGNTLDISGGGIRFYSKTTLEKDSLADCLVILKDGDKILTPIKITFVEENTYENQLVMRAKFLNLPETAQEKLIKYICAEQLKKRQADKGTGSVVVY
jgi:c-di-GMP-binding flagellar brake protein YcgR